MFVGEHLADLAARLGASVVGSEDAARVAGGELTDRSAEFAVEYLGVEATGDGVVVGRRRLGPRVGEGGCGDVLDQGIKAALLPEGEALVDAAFDVCRFDAAVAASEDASGERERAFGVPLAFAYSAEFGSQLGDYGGTDASLWREIEGVGVCDDGVVSSLPALVVGNAAVEVAAIISMDSVAKDLGESLVCIGWVIGWRGHGCGVSGGIGRWCVIARLSSLRRRWVCWRGWVRGVVAGRSAGG